MEDDYYAFNIYENCIKMLAYRQLMLVKGASYPKEAGHLQSEKPLDKTEFTRNFQQYQYIMIVAKDGPEKERRATKNMAKHTRNYPTYTHILFVMSDSRYLSKAPEVERLFKLVDLSHPPKSKNIEVLLVHDRSLSTNLLNKLEHYTYTGAASEGEEISGYQTIQPVPYLLVLSERPKHVRCSRHIPLKKAEEKELLTKVLRTEKSGLPAIRQNEAMAVWYGLQLNSVVKIIRDSETTGEGIEYRVVRPAPKS